MTSSRVYKNVASAAPNPGELQYVMEEKKSTSAIIVQMQIRFEGISRPICTACGHSVMSHGELNGRVFCWSCRAAGNKQCAHESAGQNSMCVK